jgi:hypothetical protein
MIFRENTKGMILDNITGRVVSKLVKVMLSIDLLFTVPIVLSAPRRLIERLVISDVRLVFAPLLSAFCSRLAVLFDTG